MNQTIGSQPPGHEHESTAGQGRGRPASRPVLQVLPSSPRLPLAPVHLLLLLLLPAVLLAWGSTGCSKSRKASPAAEESAEHEPAAVQDELPELTSEQQARVDALQEGSPLLPLELARALLRAPSPWAREIVRKVYPRAEVKEDNPRVNVVLEPGEGAAPVSLLDVRWEPTDRTVIGSLGVVYSASVDKEALQKAIDEAARPEEGAPHDWLTPDGSMRLTYYAQGYEGETRVSFSPRELAGRAISHEDDKMKEVQAWEVARPRDSRVPEEAPDPRLQPPDADGKGKAGRPAKGGAAKSRPAGRE